MRAIILAIFISMFPHYALASGPTTPILDSFTCANSSSALCSATWAYSSNAVWGNDALGISSNKAYNPTNTNGGNGIWNSSFTGTIDAYVTFNTAGKSEAIDFITAPTTYTGYIFLFATSQIQVYICSASSCSLSSKNGFPFSYTEASGDSLWVQYTAGGHYAVSYEHSGVWTLAGTYVDTTYSTPYIGLGIDSTSTRATNFGGGIVSSGAVNHGFTRFL